MLWQGRQTREGTSECLGGGLTSGVECESVGEEGAEEGRMDEAEASRLEVGPEGVGNVRGYEFDEQGAQKT